MDLQGGASVGRRRAGGVGVRADPLQHAGGGPVVKGQLPGAVAAQADPHGPQEHSQARHAPLSWGGHRHMVVGLRLEGDGCNVSV